MAACPGQPDSKRKARTNLSLTASELPNGAIGQCQARGWRSSVAQGGGRCSEAMMAGWVAHRWMLGMLEPWPVIACQLPLGLRLLWTDFISQMVVWESSRPCGVGTQWAAPQWGHHAGSLGIQGLSLHWLPMQGHGFSSLGKWRGVLVLDLGELLALSPRDSAFSGAGKELARGRW